MIDWQNAGHYSSGYEYAIRSMLSMFWLAVHKATPCHWVYMHTMSVMSLFKRLLRSFCVTHCVILNVILNAFNELNGGNFVRWRLFVISCKMTLTMT